MSGGSERERGREGRPSFGFLHSKAQTLLGAQRARSWSRWEAKLTACSELKQRKEDIIDNGKVKKMFFLFKYYGTQHFD
jgi:hypothetical protein